MMSFALVSKLVLYVLSVTSWDLEVELKLNYKVKGHHPPVPKSVFHWHRWGSQAVLYCTLSNRQTLMVL